MTYLSWTPPRWLSALIGVAAIVAGVALTFKPFSSLDALTLFVGIALIVTGIGEFLTDPDEPYPLLPKIMGVVLVLTGLAALALRGQTDGAVAVVVGVGLLLSGLTRLWAVVRGQTDERFVSLAGGLASAIFGVLALSWPDATILVVALLVGPVAIIFGISRVIRAVLGRAWGEPNAQEISAEKPWLNHTFKVVRVTLSLIIALVLAGVSGVLHHGSPEVSAFYQAPGDLPTKPGQLVRSESFSRNLPENSRGELILFTTTALNGSIGVASALVIVPTADATEPRPVLLWEHGTTGTAEQCAPSLLDDPLGAGAMPARQQVIDNGWVLIAPDYLGLGTRGPHPYLIGVPTAQSSLDAVRAARQLEGLSLSDKTVVWGHSQGGAAALWVGIEASSYTSDVPLAGVAAMAPASDLPNLAAGMLDDPAGQLFGAFIVDAYSKVYPDVNFDDYVRDSAQTVLRQAVERCLSEPSTLLSAAAVLSNEDLYKEDPTDGPLGAHLVDNVPNIPSGVPTFLAQGMDDTLINPGVQASFVAALCGAGGVIAYHTYADRDHLSLVADDSPMIPDLIEWTKARFAGEPADPTCGTIAG